jgi:hypothetical protein
MIVNFLSKLGVQALRAFQLPINVHKVSWTVNWAASSKPDGLFHKKIPLHRMFHAYLLIKKLVLKNKKNL